MRGVEFDLVARRGDETWFVEVKTRSSARCGFPYEYVTPEKRSRMESGAIEFLENRGEGDADHRLVVASIVLAPARETPVVEWMTLE